MGWRRTDHCTDVTPCDRRTNLPFATGEVKGHRLASGGKRVCGRALMNLHGRPRDYLRVFVAGRIPSCTAWNTHTSMHAHRQQEAVRSGALSRTSGLSEVPREEIQTGGLRSEPTHPPQDGTTGADEPLIGVKR